MHKFEFIHFLKIIVQIKFYIDKGWYLFLKKVCLE